MRIERIDQNRAEPRIRAVFEAQARNWGAALLNHRLYARRPSIFCRCSGDVERNRCFEADRREAASAAQPARRELEIAEEKILTLNDYAKGSLSDERERTALEYADAMTITGRDFTDERFARLRIHFDDDALAELTVIIAFENSSSKFNRALRVPSMGLWKRSTTG